MKEAADKIIFWSEHVNSTRKMNEINLVLPSPKQCETCLSRMHFVSFDMWVATMKNFNAKKIRTKVSSSEEESP